jgi:hypothetical protein
MGAAALTALARPALWVVALAGFLARGGIVAFLLPIVVLPSPSGVANVIAPSLTSFAFGLVSSSFVEIVAALIALILAWIVLGGLVGAWADIELVQAACADEELGIGSGYLVPPGRGTLLRALGVRLLAHLPLAVALGWGAVRIVQAAYAELVTPFEVVTPLFIRVLGDVPDAIAVIVTLWLLGEAAGGLAVRHAILGRRSAAASVRDGWLDLVRRPRSSLGTLLATHVAVGLAVVSSALAAGIVWSWVRLALLGGDGPAEVGAAIGILVAVWLGGLLLTSVAVAWRSLAWTAEWLRVMPRPAVDEKVGASSLGTFSGAEHARPGGRSSSRSSGTL